MRVGSWASTDRTDGQRKNPLPVLTDLGESNEETNVSERDEEILSAEIDSIQGWSLRDDRDR